MQAPMHSLTPQPTRASDVRHYEVVAHAIRYVRAQAVQQPSLADVAKAVHLSPAHLQRVFTEWAGLSPKRFLQFLSKEHAKALLTQQRSTRETVWKTGLSSAGRLHELMVHCEAMTPTEIQARGQGLLIHWGWAETPLGTALIASTALGICHLAFSDAPTSTLPESLQAQWPRAQWLHDPALAPHWAERIFRPQVGAAQNPLPLVLKGTPFQIKVWEALLRIPLGELRSYSDVAEQIGRGQAQRAVGSAIGANTLAYLIPCHRVIRESGDWNQYRWGTERKMALHVWESSQLG